MSNAARILIAITGFLFVNTLVANKAEAAADVSCTSGFQVHFADVAQSTGIGFDHPVRGATRRNTICLVLDYIGSEINIGTATPSILVATSQTDGTGPLGTGSPFYDGPSSSGLSGGRLWKYITTQVDPSPVGSHDARILIDFGPRTIGSSTLGIHDDGSVPSVNGIDLSTVVLHELTHALGFGSAISPTGTSLLGSGDFAQYDKFLKSGSTNLVSTTGTFVGPSSAITGGPLSFVNPNLAVPFPMHAPSFYDPGSSLSHFDPWQSQPSYIMTPSAAGTDIRSFSFAERDVLCSLGYSIISGDCNNKFPIGIDDVDLTTNTTTPGTQVCINVLANDIDPDNQPSPISINPNSIDIISGGGSATISGNQICYTPSSIFAGIASINYTPNDGQRDGNATLVKVAVESSICLDNPASYVCNGSFEAPDPAPSQLNFQSMVCGASRVNNWCSAGGTADYYVRNANNQNWMSFDIPISFKSGDAGGVQTWDFPNPANNRYIGMAYSNQQNGPEGVQTELIQELIPGQQYKLDFKGISVNENSRYNPSYPGKIDVYLDAVPNPSTVFGGPSNATAQFLGTFTVNNPELSITPIQNWTSISNTFVATSAHKHLIMVGSPSGPSDVRGYTFLDDVSLVKVQPGNAQLTINKTVSNSTPHLGDEIVYSINVCNTGSGTFSQPYTVSDQMPSGLTYISGMSAFPQHTFTSPIAPNSCESVSVRAKVDWSAPQNTPLINCAGIDGTDLTSCVSITASTTDLGVQKSVSASTASPQDTISYSITVFNTSPHDAHNVEVTDLLPTGINFANATVSGANGAYDPPTGKFLLPILAGGGSAQLIISAKVGVSACGTIVNQAILTGLDETDINTVNNSATAQLEITNCSTSTSGGKPSTNASKTCEPIEPVASGPMTLNCRITASGSNLPAGSHIIVADGFGGMPPHPATIIGPMMNVTSNENWSCLDGQQNVPGSSGFCSLPAADLLAAGGTSTINVSFKFELNPNPPAGEKRPQVANCPFNDISLTSVESLFGREKSRIRKSMTLPKNGRKNGLPDGCVLIDVPPYDESLPPLKEAKVTKSCSKPEVGDIEGKPGVFWDCTITVQADPAPFSGTFELEEDASAISGSGSGDIVSVSHQNNNWACQQNLPSSATTCEIDGEYFSPSGTETLTFKLFAGIDDNKPIKWENCATGKYRPYKKEAENMGGDCDTMSWTPLPRPEKVELLKSCTEPKKGEYRKAEGLIWQCTIEVHAEPAPFDGVITFLEDATALSGSNNGNIIDVNHANQAWTCLPNAPVQATTCQINGANFSPGGTETVTFDLFVETGEEPVKWDNCVTGQYTYREQEKREIKGNCETMTWKPDDVKQTIYDIKKICKPRGDRQNLSDTAWIQAYQCQITVTTNGVPFNGPLFVQDNFTVGGGAHPQVINGMSSSDPWNCTQPSYTPGNAPSCWISGSQFPHSNGSSTINVDLVISSDMAQKGVENCSVLNAIEKGSDKPKLIGESCTPIVGDIDYDKPELTVTKTCAKPTRSGQTWNVACQVTISGSNLPAGTPIRLSDGMQSVQGYTASSGTLQSSGVPCHGNLNSGGVYAGCDLSSDDLANGPLVFNYVGAFISQSAVIHPRTAQNCVYADAPSLGLHTPMGGNGKLCVPLQLGYVLDPDLPNPEIPTEVTPKRNLKITKTQRDSCTAGSVCRFHIGVLNTGDVPMNIPQIVDQITPHMGVTVQSSSLPWVCSMSGGNVICNPSTPMTLQPGSGMTMTVNLNMPRNLTGEVGNCARLNWLPYMVPYQDRSLRSVQQALTNKGFKPGPVDGAMGQLTRDAIRRFERQNGLPVTGEVNEKMAGLLFGVFKPLGIGDDIKADDNSCINVNYKPADPIHDRRQSFLENHNTYRSSLVEFHRQYKSSLHDGKSTILRHDRRKSEIRDHDKRVSRIHRRYKSAQHEASTTRIRGDHTRRTSQGDTHNKRISRFHRQYKSELHNASTTRIVVEHNRQRSRLRDFHKKFKSNQHDGRKTSLRHDRRRSFEENHDKRLSRFHRKYKSVQHDERTTKIRREHSKVESRLRDFHKKYKSNQHDGRKTSLRHDRRKSIEANHDKRLSSFHRKYKSAQHDARTTKVRREHSKVESKLRDFHKKFKSNQHDGRTTRLRHDRRRSIEANHDKRISRFHRRLKSVMHDPKTSRVRQLKPRPLNPEGQVKK